MFECGNYFYVFAILVSKWQSNTEDWFQIGSFVWWSNVDDNGYVYDDQYDENNSPMVKIMITVIMQDHDDQKYAADCVKCWIVGLTTLDPHPPQRIPPMAAPLSLILPFIIIIININIIINN